MNDTKIIFVGTTDFSRAILQTLLDEGYNIIATVSQPDRIKGRKKVLTPTPVHALSKEYNIVCLQPEKLRKEFQDIIDLKPDVIVTCAYGQIVPEEVLTCPRVGCLNIHPSLLPKYRGGAPMHYPLLNGDKETGVSLMEMTKQMDAGKVYAQRKVMIDEDDTESDLEAKLLETSIAMIKAYLPQYIEGSLQGEKQDEEKATFCHNISSDLEQVHFQKEDIVTLYNHMRALIDWPIPYAMLEGKRVRFYKVRKQECEMKEASGTILGFQKDCMEVACIGGKILVYELQTEGGKRMDAKSFKNGYAKEVIGKRFD